MTHEQWFISDTHFFHTNIIKFTNSEGERIRPFKDLDEMHNLIVYNWNKAVQPNDYVYHLGDVTFQYHRPFQELMYSLNGDKRLIVGNHDKLKQEGLTKHFSKIMLWHGFKEHNFTAIHIPIQQRSLRDGNYCVHGHEHQNPPKDYHCLSVCVELRDYSPVHIETLAKEIKEKEDNLK